MPPSKIIFTYHAKLLTLNLFVYSESVIESMFSTMTIGVLELQ